MEMPSKFLKILLILFAVVVCAFGYYKYSMYQSAENATEVAKEEEVIFEYDVDFEQDQSENEEYNQADEQADEKNSDVEEETVAE